MDFFDILLASKLNRSGGGAVNSVNGQTGTVELTAEDVGAIAKTELQATINTALAQANASGEFDGADGKSAYQYAVDSGYTGTEAEFAEKLAAEMPTTLPNPNALTFTGAVEGSYDGSAPLSVEIPRAVTDEHINNLINTALGVIENGTY